MRLSASIVATALALPSLTQAWSSDYGSCFPSSAGGLMMSRMERRREAMDRKFARLEEALTRPTFQIVKDEGQYQVAVPVPGFSHKDIQIDVQGKMLTIKGERDAESDKFSFTSNFEQSFTIDSSVLVDEITASLQDGVLVVSAPRDVPKPKVRQIPISFEADGGAKEVVSSSVESSAEAEEENTIEGKKPDNGEQDESEADKESSRDEL